MHSNDDLKVHFVNVNHGDSTILELPDLVSETGDRTVRLGVVDFGAKTAADRALARDYMQALVDFRRGDDDALDYQIEFACVTHPHNDHYGGLNRFMEVFADPDSEGANRVKRFWDCGFRTNAVTYNRALNGIASNPHVTFTRVAAGSEFQFGEVLVQILAPSVDLRNRFDTFGVDRNNASIVLRVRYRDSRIILAGDAEFASWGKVTEEFPRAEPITLYEDALGLSERDEASDQLKCDLLKLAHHGSKHGTSLEYLERLDPNRIVIPAGDDAWYLAHKPGWLNMFPHPLVSQTLQVLNADADVFVTGDVGNLIFTYTGGWRPHGDPAQFSERPASAGFDTALANAWG
jgi:competence protein ComEC